MRGLPNLSPDCPVGPGLFKSEREGVQLHSDAVITSDQQMAVSTSPSLFVPRGRKGSERSP